MHYFIKLFVSAFIIVVVTEFSKTNAVIGGLIKSLPLISVLSFIILFSETGDIQKVSELSTSTFWFVLPTLPLFLVLPWFLRSGLNFYLSLILSMGIMFICYVLTMQILRLCNINL